jgi:hypothetical protein
MSRRMLIQSSRQVSFARTHTNLSVKEMWDLSPSSAASHALLVS